MFNNKISALSIFVGFIVVVATSIVLSLLNLVFFSHLITKSAPLNILNISAGPLFYSLFVLLASVITGIFIASNIAKYSSIFNAIGVVFLYAIFSYLLSQSPSNVGKYPLWFVVSSYIVLIPALFSGHFLATKFSKTNT